MAWITFGRRDLKGIQTEIGSLLRPDTFNPALRAQRNEPEEEEVEQEITQEESQPETIPNIRYVSHLVPIEYCDYSIVLHAVVKMKLLLSLMHSW